MKKYVPAYSMNPGLSTFTPEDLRTLTHINLAFGVLKDGLLDMSGLPDIGLCGRFREWNPDIKLVLSVGGWGAGGFPDMDWRQGHKPRPFAGRRSRHAGA